MDQGTGRWGIGVALGLPFEPAEAGQFAQGGAILGVPARTARVKALEIGLAPDWCIESVNAGGIAGALGTLLGGVLTGARA